MIACSVFDSLPVPTVSRRDEELVRVLLKRIAKDNGCVKMNSNSWLKFCKQTCRNISNVCLEDDSVSVNIFLDKFSSIFKYRKIKGDYFVEANVNLPLCKEHLSKRKCHKLICYELHCCKYYLLDSCIYKKNCIYGHNLTSGNNHKLLAKQFLDKMSPQELGVLLKLSMPKVCKFYNGSDGDCKHGNEGKNCSALHLCKFFVLGNCSEGANCQHSHDLFGSQSKALLAKHGVNVSRSTREILDELRKMDISDNELESDIEENLVNFPRFCKYYNVEEGCRYGAEGKQCHQLHVCRHFVVGSCKFGSACRRSHNLFDPQPKAVLLKHGVNVEQSPEVLLAKFRASIDKGSESDSSSVCSERSIPAMHGIDGKKFEIIPSLLDRDFSDCDSESDRNSVSSDSNAESMSPRIRSYVFLDLEATSLEKARITEISMVAVNRLSIEYLADKCHNSRATYFPRVVNKLTLCVCPMKPIDSKVSSMTGLYNDELDHQKDFDSDLAEMMSIFLKRLEPPVCLIAHNGFGFDFPLLKGELSSIGCNLPDGILCADTWLMCRSLDGHPVAESCSYLPFPRINRKLRNSTNFEEHSTESKKMKVDNMTPIKQSELILISGSVAAKKRLFPPLEVAPAESENSKRFSEQSVEEFESASDITDEKMPGHNQMNRNGSNSHDIESNLTQVEESRESPIPSDDNLAESESVLQVRSGRKTNQKLPSYKLKEIHKRVTGSYPTETHRAEDDCFALARIFMFAVGSFRWVDNNSVPFADFSPMHLSPQKPLSPHIFPTNLNLD